MDGSVVGGSVVNGGVVVGGSVLGGSECSGWSVVVVRSEGGCDVVVCGRRLNLVPQGGSSTLRKNTP